MEMAQLLVFAIISCIYGVGIFYFCPLSLLSRNAELLMDLMLLIFFVLFVIVHDDLTLNHHTFLVLSFQIIYFL